MRGGKPMARLLFAVVLVLSTVLCGSLACRPVFDTERPSVATNDAIDIATGVATLNGNLTSLGTASTVEVSFQWGTSSGSYANETTAQVKTSAEEFSFELTFLSPNTTYYFRVRAAGDGTVYGSQKEFTTSEAETLTILSHEMTTGAMYILKVTGQAKNISSGKLNYAEVDVRFKDAQGVILQTGVENIADLNPGDVWDFEVLYPSSNISKVASYEISVGTIW
jgi:hypothetical protein